MCQSALGEGTLYSLLEMGTGIAQRNVVLIGSISEIHSLIRVTETCMPSPLRIPLIMFCPASGIVCTMRSIQARNSTLEISVNSWSVNPYSHLMVYSVCLLIPKREAIWVHENLKSQRNVICSFWMNNLGRPRPGPLVEVLQVWLCHSQCLPTYFSLLAMHSTNPVIHLKLPHTNSHSLPQSCL